MKIPSAISKIAKRKSDAAFTMMEIAISLAVIGIALVAIIGILPLGMRTQRENRELTLINQDATVFIESIRNGARGHFETDLTNYVFAITNYHTLYNPSPNATVVLGYDTAYLTNNERILGLMSTPEYTDVNGLPIPALVTNLPGGCYSNHLVAYVHSLSGQAVEKPPQNNSILLQSGFSYRIVCENLPTATSLPPQWQSAQAYNPGDRVYYIFPTGEITYWQSQAGTNTDTPGQSQRWTRDGYTQTMAENLRDVRLTFLWPQLPNGNLGNGHWTYRMTVAGQLASTNDVGSTLYFFQPQSFVTNAP